MENRKHETENRKPVNLPIFHFRFSISGFRFPVFHFFPFRSGYGE